MIFRKISIEDTIKFTDENETEIKNMMEDYDDIPDNIYSKEKCLKQILTALALCHNVTPVY
jgi:magnesium-transporting ATPase (P-type)